MPWRADFQKKTLLDSLHDIFCTLPGLLEDIKRLKNAIDTPLLDEKSTDNLSRNVLSALDALHQWRLNWNAVHARTASSVAEEQVVQPFNERNVNFTPASTLTIRFEKLQRAAELCLFNAMVLILLRIGETLKTRLHPTGPLEWRQELFISRFGSPQRLGEEIAQMAPYMSEAQHGNKGIYLLSFPLQIARSRLEPGSTVFEWVERTLESIHSKFGVYVPDDL